MLFSNEIKEKLVEVFFKENVNRKLTKEEMKNGEKINLDLEREINYASFIVTTMFSILLTLPYLLVIKNDTLTISLAIIIQFIISFCFTQILFYNQKKYLKPLRKKINKESIMKSLKITLKEIVNNNEENENLILEAKNYISMLLKGEEDLIYEKIKKEKIFFERSKNINNDICKKYYLYCKEKNNEIENKILSKEDLIKVKIDSLEKFGFNAKLEINKILQK